MRPDIRFTWAGKKYTMPYEAYSSEYIVLPDGTALQPLGWLESYPPQLGGAKVIPHLFQSLPVAEIIANLGNAVAATEVME